MSVNMARQAAPLPKGSVFVVLLTELPQAAFSTFELAVAAVNALRGERQKGEPEWVADSAGRCWEPKGKRGRWWDDYEIWRLNLNGRIDP